MEDNTVQNQETVEPKASANPTDVPAGVGSLGNVVLEQQQTNSFETPFAVQFVEKIFGSDGKQVKGSEERYGVAYPASGQAFSKEAFIPSIANTGGSSARRDPAGKILVNPNFIYPLFSDENIKMFYRTYLTGQYVGQLLNHEPIDKVMAEALLEQDMKYAEANQLLFGSDMTNANGTAQRYEGLADIYKVAKGTGNASDVNSIDLLSKTNTNKHITYTPVSATTSESSLLEAINQLKQLIFKMHNLNSYFSYGFASDGTTRPLNSAGQSIPRKYVMVADNRLIEIIRSFNGTIFKDLSSYFAVDSIEAIPYTTFDTAHVAGDAQMATPISVIGTGKIDIQPDEVLIFDANGLCKREYQITPSSKDFFSTNITDKVQKQKLFWSNVKVDTPCAVFSFGSALDFIALPTVDIKKTA